MVLRETAVLLPSMQCIQVPNLNTCLECNVNLDSIPVLLLSRAALEAQPHLLLSFLLSLVSQVVSSMDRRLTP